MSIRQGEPSKAVVNYPSLVEIQGSCRAVANEMLLGTAEGTSSSPLGGFLKYSSWSRRRMLRRNATCSNELSEIGDLLYETAERIPGSSGCRRKVEIATTEDKLSSIIDIF
jgi:hypothetical protein